jgi:F-type H+-transporting ATPase subunit epsilon
MPLRFELVTADRVVMEEEGVDMVVAPGADGVLGILPRHVPLITTLVAGELRIKRGGAEESLIVTGGFMEVTPDKVLVLADAAEHSDEIDLARAEEARRRAQERIAAGDIGIDQARAAAALQRSLIRIRVAQRRRGSGRAPTPEDRGQG